MELRQKTTISDTVRQLSVTTSVTPPETALTYELLPLPWRHDGQPIPVTADEYQALYRTRALLVSTIGFEESFWILNENNLDYERELHDIGLSTALSANFQWGEIRHDTLTVDRRLLNFLASSRSYLDGVRSALKRHHDPEKYQQLKADICSQHDSKLGYRVMEALRNVLVHKRGSATSLSYLHDREAEYLRVRPVPRLRVARLKEAKVKSEVVDELAALGESHELNLFVREYVEGLGHIHALARSLTGEAVVSACELYRSWIAKGQERWPASHGLFQVVDGSPLTREFHVFDDFPARCLQLRSRPYRLENWSKLFVSGQLAGPEA